MFRNLAAYQHLVPLLLRVGVGLTFFFSGYAKVAGGVENVAGFFGNLGIPLPGAMAPFVAYLELIGGLALIVGALTEVFSFLFICVMVVAILTAKLPAFAQAASLAEGWTEIRIEVMLLLASACLLLLGAGRYSVDTAVLGNRSTEPEDRTTMTRA